MQFGYKAGILDRDDGLIREIRQYGNLLVGKRLDLSSPNYDYADDRVSFQHWRCKDGSMHFFLAADTYSPAIVGVSECIGNVHDATFQHSAARSGIPILVDWALFHLLEKFIRVAEAGRNSINVPILPVDEAHFSAA